MCEAIDKMLVLDLDECLIRSHPNKDGNEKSIAMMDPTSVSDRRKFFKATVPTQTKTVTFWGVKRPFLDEFLFFAARYFSVIIVWSAGDKDYVHELVNVIFKDHKRPDEVLTRDDVIYMPVIKKGIDISAGDYHKPLSVIQSKYPGLIDLKHTLFIDDKIDNFRSNIGNGIAIPKFEPKPSRSFIKADKFFLHFINWLMTDEVKCSQDVRILDKEKIISQSCKNKFPELTTPEHIFLFAPIAL